MAKKSFLSKTEKQFEKQIHKREKQTVALAKTLVNRKRYNRFLRILGPGLVTGAADDDPSGITTYSQTGAMFGYKLLWIFPFMFPILLAVQESCARVGAITGKGLAAVIKDNYSRKILTPLVILVVIANVINIGADLGAMAATTQLFIDANYSVLTIFYALIIIGLIVLVRYKTYAKILKWLAVVLFAYPITALLVRQDWPEVFRHTFSMPEFSMSTVYILVAILGTTISPYLFFWDTSEVVEEEISKRNISKIGVKPLSTKHFLHNIRLDNFVGMALAILTAWFIVIACAATLHNSGITEINNAQDAAKALEPLVQGFPNSGLIAKLIFSVGIVGIGLLAIPVLAGSSSYAVSELMGWQEGLHRKYKRAANFYGIIILAILIGLAINFLGIDPIKALIFSAVFNSVASVPLLFMIAKVGNNRSIMGEYKNGRLSNIFIRLAFIVTFLATVFLLISYFI